MAQGVEAQPVDSQTLDLFPDPQAVQDHVQAGAEGVHVHHFAATFGEQQVGALTIVDVAAQGVKQVGRERRVTLLPVAPSLGGVNRIAGDRLLDLELARGLNPELPPLRVGIKAGFEDTEEAGAEAGAGALPTEYFEPDASATF